LQLASSRILESNKEFHIRPYVLGLCESFKKLAEDGNLYYHESAGRVVTELFPSESYVVKLKSPLFVFGCARIYLSVNLINMKAIHDNEKYIRENFTISLLDFLFSAVYETDCQLSGSKPSLHSHVTIMRKEFTNHLSENRTLRSFYQKGFGDELFKALQKHDCIICLCPKAKLFSKEVCAKIKSDDLESGGVLGFDEGGFVAAQTVARGHKGK
jgi:hypothetical protein